MTYEELRMEIKLGRPYITNEEAQILLSEIANKIWRGVTEETPLPRCNYCGQSGDTPQDINHTPPCPFIVMHNALKKTDEAPKETQTQQSWKRPEPVAYVIKEGDGWLEWVNWPTNKSKTAHAIKFSDGSIFDMVNGWRKNTI